MQQLSQEMIMVLFVVLLLMMMMMQTRHMNCRQRPTWDEIVELATDVAGA
tara:strand:+ start:2064 stop:2213 length:150 start_codon:yes stop_codon:yes gene_type:complete